MSKENKEQRITFRLTNREYEYLKKQAELLNIDIAKYLRLVINNFDINIYSKTLY